MDGAWRCPTVQFDVVVAQFVITAVPIRGDAQRVRGRVIRRVARSFWSITSAPKQVRGAPSRSAFRQSRAAGGRNSASAAWLIGRNVTAGRARVGAPANAAARPFLVDPLRAPRLSGTLSHMQSYASACPRMERAMAREICFFVLVMSTLLLAVAGRCAAGRRRRTRVATQG